MRSARSTFLPSRSSARRKKWWGRGRGRGRTGTGRVSGSVVGALQAPSGRAEAARSPQNTMRSYSDAEHMLTCVGELDQLVDRPLSTCSAALMCGRYRDRSPDSPFCFFLPSLCTPRSSLRAGKEGRNLAASPRCVPPWTASLPPTAMVVEAAPALLDMLRGSSTPLRCLFGWSAAPPRQGDDPAATPQVVV